MNTKNNFPCFPNLPDTEVLWLGQQEQVKNPEYFLGQPIRANIQYLPIADFFTRNSPCLERTYHYIYVYPETGKDYGAALMGELPGLLALLKQGGVLCTAVYGYTGYFGLEMVSTMIKQCIGWSAGFLGSENDLEVARAIIASLSPDHPAYRQKKILTDLQDGKKEVLERLLRIDGDNLFTVSRLLAFIRQQGGTFMNWVNPELYEPGRFIQDKKLLEVLESLPVPQRWEIAELVNASPDDHHFLITRTP